jgi:hypothetical protein
VLTATLGVKTMKALHIDVARREIREVTLSDLHDMQSFVGGYIEAVPLNWIDTLYVNEDGMRSIPPGFFRVAGVLNPLIGHGLLVGRERFDSEGEYLGLDDPKMTAAELASKVEFITRAQFDAWGRANASDPAAVVTMFGPYGDVVSSAVLGRYGEMVANVPRSED